jgi:hypothetical protein
VSIISLSQKLALVEAYAEDCGHFGVDVMITIFGEKICVFLKSQCYDHFFHNLAFDSKNAIFAPIFLAKIFLKS